MLDFKLYLSVKFNREINKNKDYISPGGFDFNIDNKQLQFDFETSYSNIDNNDKTILHCELVNLDYEEFEDLKNLKYYDINKLNSITGAYIYTDWDEKSEPLYPISFIKISLVFSDENEYNIPKRILNSYNKKLIKDNINEKAKKSFIINKCKNNYIYFIRKILNFHPFNYQKKILNKCLKDDDNEKK